MTPASAAASPLKTKCRRPHAKASTAATARQSPQPATQSPPTASLGGPGNQKHPRKHAKGKKQAQASTSTKAQEAARRRGGRTDEPEENRNCPARPLRPGCAGRSRWRLPDRKSRPGRSTRRRCRPTSPPARKGRSSSSPRTSAPKPPKGRSRSPTTVPGGALASSSPATTASSTSARSATTRRLRPHSRPAAPTCRPRRSPAPTPGPLRSVPAMSLKRRS